MFKLLPSDSVRGRALFAATLAVCCTGAIRAKHASASPLLELVGDTAAPAGMQGRTVANGSAAAYFNPALLVDAPAGVSVGFAIVNSRIGIRLDGRPGTEFAIPEGLENAGHADFSRFDNYAIATDLLQNGREADERNEAFTARPRQASGSGHETLTYETFGLNVKLLDDYLAVGLHTLVPNGEFTRMRAFFSDEREQYFSNSLHPELYGDRMTALSIALGAGVKLLDSLSLGAGATFSLKANVQAPTYVVDTGRLDEILIDMNTSVNIVIAPHFGARYAPSDRLRLTATVHTPQRVELGTGFTFLLANAIEQASGVTFVLDYMPWRVGLGGSYDVLASAEQAVTLAASALFAGWSAYEDRHGASPSPAFAWSNTLSATGGVRYRISRFTTALDLSFTPTPVPGQMGRTNYVDNDRIGASFGGEQTFRVLGTDLKLGAQVQAHRLVPRHHRKLPTPTREDGENAAPELVKDELPDDAQLSGDPIAAARGLQTNNPGWPGFASGGWVLGATVYLTLAL